MKINFTKIVSKISEDFKWIRKSKPCLCSFLLPVYAWYYCVTAKPKIDPVTGEVDNPVPKCRVLCSSLWGMAVCAFLQLGLPFIIYLMVKCFHLLLWVLGIAAVLVVLSIVHERIGKWCEYKKTVSK